MSQHKVYTSLYNGLPIFGSPTAYTQVNLQLGTTEELAAFLGVPSVQYGADSAGGGVYGITGVFTGNTPAAVEAALAFMQAQMSRPGNRITASWWQLTGDIFPSIAVEKHNCYFTAADLVTDPAGTQKAGINSWSLSYNLVMRQAGNV